MQAAAHEFADAPIHQRRAHKRFDYVAPCLVKRESHTLTADVQNISRGGANLRLQQDGSMPVGKTVTLTIGDFAPINAVVRWNEGTSYGVQFLASLDSNAELRAVIDTFEAG